MKVRLTFEGQAPDGDGVEALREVVETRLEDVAELRLVKVEDVGAARKERFGEYENVLLTEAEFGELKRLYGRSLAYKLIDRFSAKLKEKGYRYRDHFTTIVEWQKEDRVTITEEELNNSLGDLFRAVIEAGEEESDD